MMEESSANKIQIICISGKARHGKDTVAGYLKTEMERLGYRTIVTHYGDLVKYISKQFFNWNGEKDEIGRTILQKVGTDIFRKKDPDYWVRFINSVIDICPTLYDCWIIPDCRFPNEIESMYGLNRYVTHLHVTRGDIFDNGLTEEQKNHPSETALDEIEPDFVVLNTGTLTQLQDEVRDLVNNNFLPKN